MNNIIFQTIRAGVVLGVALFAFVGSATAAPTLLSASVSEITGTSAVLRGYFQNNGERTLVRFEWSEASSVSAPAVVGLKDTFFDGFFTARLDGLTPGVTYSYRAVATSGGVTVTSPVASFKTVSQTSPVSIGNSSLGVGPITAPVVKTKVATQTETSKTITPVVATKQETTPLVTKQGFTNGNTNVAPVVITKEGFTNGNSATVIGAGNNLFPSTLIGWLLLILAILVVALIGRMIYESSGNRRKTYVEIETETE